MEFVSSTASTYNIHSTVCADCGEGDGGVGGGGVGDVFGPECSLCDRH